MIMASEDTINKQDQIFEKEFLPQIDALYTFAYHLTYDEDDANDLVQETYLKAYRFIDRYIEGTNAKAWLFKILKNAFINQYRKQSKQPTKVDFEEIVSFHDEENTTFSGYLDLREEMFEHMIGDEVTNAINALPVDFRVVILLCDIEGFTYEEISKIVNIPIGTVRSRLHRARNMLKERLKEYAQKHGYRDKEAKKTNNYSNITFLTTISWWFIQHSPRTIVIAMHNCNAFRLHKKCNWKFYVLNFLRLLFR